MTSRGRVQITFTHRVLIFVVVLGAVTVAGIGFAGSYSAVSDLAVSKGFGAYAPWFPIGVDVSILTLLSLDVLLDWLGMSLVLLRYAAWLLAGATVVFNAMSAYPDALGMAMHGTIPLSFLAAVEAARRSISRIAGLSEDRRMDGVRVSRWLLAPLSTALLWRRMKLFELRSYDAVIKLEQERLVYRARLKSRYGRGWRRRAPVESLMPLRLARYGVPLAQTAPAGLAAAGIDPALLPTLSEQNGKIVAESSPPAQSKPAKPSIQPRPPKTKKVGSDVPSVAEHTEKVVALKPADAVRYAIDVLGTVETSALTRWLKDHGRSVNSGQVWRIAQKAQGDIASDSGRGGSGTHSSATAD
ncbi:DUF2637 domain-containing protein [Streptomyces qinglanensis]|uniref:DUF2637 domain-containing protein n=1 Tax=Streptomyces qinglanensis TaxID=943816 RepID=UPI003D74631C